MRTLERKDHSGAYGESPAEEVPAKEEIFCNNYEEALAGKKGKSKINRSLMGLKVVTVERSDEQRMLDESKTVTNMFCSLSKDNQLMLRPVIESFIRLSPSEQAALCAVIKDFANFSEDKQSEVSRFVKYLERTSKTDQSDPDENIQPDVTKSKLGIQQRPKGERTERTNLSFPPLLKDALTRAAEKQNKSVSFYVSDVLSEQPEIKRELSV
jgi:hypothetical protein